MRVSRRCTPRSSQCTRCFSVAETSKLKTNPHQQQGRQQQQQQTRHVLAHRLDGLDHPTVWQEFSPLAAEYNSINLGQGFPDWQPPDFVIQALQKSVGPERAANQYARSAAHLPLAKVLVQEYEQRWNIAMDPVTQVATTVGCTNGLYCAIQGLVNPGDEVILMEPAFDIYHAAVRMAGGKPVFCPLRPQSDGFTNEKTPSANQVFTLDVDELESCISEKTKVFILNTPHNPTGKMFTLSEMQAIADMLRKYPHVTVLADEVYEHITFDKVHTPHVSMATLLWDQTLTLSSAGKTFSCTGWKVGWAVGPPRLVQAVSSVQQWTSFSIPTPTQDAVAQILEQAREPYQGFDNYYDYLADLYKGKRNLLQNALETAGLRVVAPPGGFFIMAETSDWAEPPPEIYNISTPAMPRNMPRDWALSRWCTQEIGVTAIPPSVFYSPVNVPLARNFLRFAFCKQDDTLREAHRRFAAYFGKEQ